MCLGSLQLLNDSATQYPTGPVGRVQCDEQSDFYLTFGELAAKEKNIGAYFLRVN